jgi:hypothetical protein
LCLNVTDISYAKSKAGRTPEGQPEGKNIEKEIAQKRKKLEDLSKEIKEKKKASKEAAVEEKKVKQVIENNVPENIQDIAKALACNPVWLPEHRQDFLIAFLKVFKEKKNFSVDKLDYLTDFVRTYRPVTILDMESMLNNLIEACNEDVHKIEGGHYLYYHDLIERHYMGSDNEQQFSENLLHSKERHIVMAMELLRDFTALRETQKEYMV